MSSPERTVFLSPNARADFSDILLYTLQQWGEDQRDRYEALLTRAIAGLADFPDTGPRRPRLIAGCRVRALLRNTLCITGFWTGKSRLSVSCTNVWIPYGTSGDSGIPRCDRDLNKGKPRGDDALPCITRQRVLHDAGHRSHIMLR